jgi:HPt (histidine-containing phosphotransfer) domain-containing protein
MGDLIDRAAFDSLLETIGDDPTFLAELIDTYLEDSEHLLDAMHQAIADADTAELRRAAHSLKSNSASFGARKLVSMAQELEWRARDSTIEDAAARLANIAVAYADVRRELRTLRPVS